MQVFGVYKSVITGTEVECALIVQDGVAEWRHSDGQRITGSPIWTSNQLDGLEWFRKVYADLGARFEMR